MQTHLCIDRTMIVLSILAMVSMVGAAILHRLLPQVLIVGGGGSRGFAKVIDFLCSEVTLVGLKGFFIQPGFLAKAFQLLSMHEFRSFLRS